MVETDKVIIFQDSGVSGVVLRDLIFEESDKDIIGSHSSIEE